MQLLPQSNIRTKQTNTKHSRIKQSVWTDSGPDISSMTNIKTWIRLLNITRQKIINPLFHSVMWETAGLTTTTTVSGKTTTETTQMKPTTLTSLQDGLFLQDQGTKHEISLENNLTGRSLTCGTTKLCFLRPVLPATGPQCTRIRITQGEKFKPDFAFRSPLGMEPTFFVHLEKKLDQKFILQAEKMPKWSHCSRIILTCSMKQPLLTGEPTEASPTTWPWLGGWETSTTEVYLISFCLNFCQHENTKETLAWGWEKSST